MKHCSEALGFAQALAQLRRPRLGRALLAAGADWALIFGGLALVRICGLPAVPFAILLIGNRQRALGNLLHDAAHGSFGRGPAAEWAARWLLFRPLWNSPEIYRREHFAHHRSLGIPGEDPDLIHAEADLRDGWLALLWRHLRDRRSWIGSTFGHLPRAGALERGLMLAWWSALLLALALLLEPMAALQFAGLWLAARATAFHLITTFREISDHVGLKPGTLIGFSRNQLAGGLWGELFHPHHNGYHLLHHLNPAIPCHALPRAHKLLLAWPEYAAATFCDSYFFGETALLHSWVRAGTAQPQTGEPLRARDIVGSPA